MSYRPLESGPHPVGVRTESLANPQRDGAVVTVELWYPARGAPSVEEAEDRFELAPLGTASQQAARWAAMAEGICPLVVFSHDYGGSRLQLAYLCCHLASHGYLVAAPDHEQATHRDVTLRAFASLLHGDRPSLDGAIRRVIWQHPSELSLIVQALGGDQVAFAAGRVDASRVAVAGHGLGAWIAMKAATFLIEARAAILVAPVGGNDEGLGGDLVDEPVPGYHGVASLFVAAARDSVVPLDAIERLYGRTAAPKRLAIIGEADHMQFSELPTEAQEWLRLTDIARKLIPTVAPVSPARELCPGPRVHDALKAMALAQLDAALGGRTDAAAWLDGAATSLGLEMRRADPHR